MNNYNHHKTMIQQVAEALGDELLAQVAFVGGCTTGLLLTDQVTQENIRHTTDVDLIVHVVGQFGWEALRQQLERHNFRSSMEDDVICRLRLGELKVDFMPDDSSIMGFTNIWYKEALEQAQNYPITEMISIRILTPPYFLATKFEAFKGRGNGDILTSHDMEDIMNLVDGREELFSEVLVAKIGLRSYIAKQVQELLDHEDLSYLLQSQTSGDSAREDIIYSRLENLSRQP